MIQLFLCVHPHNLMMDVRRYFKNVNINIFSVFDDFNNISQIIFTLVVILVLPPPPPLGCIGKYAHNTATSNA